MGGKDEQSPKIEYSRSQLMNLGHRAQRDDEKSMQQLIKGLEQKQIMRSQKMASKPRTKAPPHLNDNFTGLEAQSPETYLPASAKINHYSNEQVDDKPDLSFSANAKVDRWLNSGEIPNEYAKESAEYVVVDYANLGMTSKAIETASNVSTKSEIRSKLLDKTAKVKQTLRNLTQNNN